MTQQQTLTLSEDQLRAILEQTLSPDSDSRKTAETHLAAAIRIEGHPLAVLRIVERKDTPIAIRQAAVVHFKNVVKKGWDTSKDPEERDGIVISSNDRTLIKENLVQLMCEVPANIQSQCSEAISLIAQVDFPENWENLLPSLVQQFNSNEMPILHGVLLTANSIFKRFRFVQRSDQLYRDILYSLERIQEPLLHLFKQTDHAIDTHSSNKQLLKPRVEALRLISRIYYSLIYQDLPEFFEDTIAEWMPVFAKYLTYQNPLLTDLTEELEASPIDRLQAAIVDNLTLYTDKDEEAFAPFLSTFTQHVWTLLMGLTSWSKHDVLAAKCIRFLTSLVKKPIHRDLFKEDATLRQLIAKIVIPNLAVRQIDQDRFEEDPEEFIATDIQGSETDSRRRCSQELLRVMCDQFEAETALICHEHIGTMLMEYQNSPNEKWSTKDTAIHLMFGISIKAESASHGVSQVRNLGDLMDFFSKHVVQDLQDSDHHARQMLKSTSIKFVRVFRNQFSREQLVALMPMLITHLSSPTVVVHTYAAFVIEQIMSTKDGDVLKFSAAELRPFLESIFTSLFRIIENQDNNENEYAMKCVMKVLLVAKDDVLPATQAVLDKLTACLGRVAKNPRNPRYNHWIFESIAALVKSVCNVEPSAASSFEAFLFPPFQLILQMDVSEFTPYVFQIFAQLLEFRPQGSGLGESYTSMLQVCLQPLAWERKANIPALTRLLKACLQQAASDMVASGSFMALLGVWQKLLSSKANEQLSFELLASVVVHVPTSALEPVLKQIFTMLLTKLQSGRTARLVRFITNFFALFVGKFGSQSFFDQLNHLQPGMGLMVMVQIWLPRLKSDPPVRLDCKMHIIALTKISCETAALLADENAKKLWGDTVATVVFLLSAPSVGQVAPDDCTNDFEISSDSGFSLLNNSRRPLEDPFVDVTDPMRSFALALAALSSSCPGKLQPIIQQYVAADPKLGAGLEKMLLTSGVSLS